MTAITEMPRLAEGKTKIVYRASDDEVLIRSKDDITAGDGARRDVLQGKAAIATATNRHVYHLLNAAGIATHFVAPVDDVTFRARSCAMIPIEVVTRRIATGSYLKRHPETTEGTRFVPLKREFFLKDDARHDPQIFEADIVAQTDMSERTPLPPESSEGGGRSDNRRSAPSRGLLTEAELAVVEREATRVFEVLERAWAAQDVVLVDLKVEFGRTADGELLLADVIDNDSWRIWPHGDKGAMKDKQVYRNLTERSAEALDAVMDNYRWVALKTEAFLHTGRGLAVILMGSESDSKIGEAIHATLQRFGVEAQLRVCSAHKDPERLLRIAREYDACGRPIVYVAVAGRSNGLGPVLDGATPHPVINCPPPSDKFGGMDLLSSLRLPGGLACTTVLEPETAALAVVKSLSAQDPALWGRLREHHRLLREAAADADVRIQS